MLRPHHLVLALLSFASLGGCASEGGGAVDAATDTRPPPADGSPDGSSPDAGMDAAADADLPDTDVPDADAAPPPCDCPPFPTVCAAPDVTVPAFTPDAAAMAAQLFDVIACAETSLELAIYEAQWECLGAGLDAALAATPDLTLTLVVDDDECPLGDCFADTLVPADRVTVVRDERSALMHHKFVIADGARLWVSSANLTRRSFCTDHNNALVVEEADIVTRYGEVFTRMVDGIFGPVTPESPVTAGEYQAYFSPESPASEAAPWLTAMVAAIDASNTSIDVMISAFTRTEVSDALIAADTRGVVVRVVVSHLFANDAPAQALFAAGIDVRRDNVHDKVMVIDGATVITGSANWSMNAWSNNENQLWVTNSAIATAFTAEVDTLLLTAEAVTAP